MKTKEIILFDNTNDCSRYESTREYLFENYAEENGWTCLEEVSDTDVQNQIDMENDDDWYFLKQKLEDMLSNGHYLLTGYCGRWNVRAEGGKFITNSQQLFSCISHLDGIKFTDSNGHLYIDGYHHDGNDHYELKKLTLKGIQYADSNYFANDRKLHNTIMNCNFYSRLPRVAST